MKPPYHFGLSQEDERTEAAALGLPGGHVLSIAGAGDVALSLLALGADEVTAVDVDSSQLHLGELKRAAVCSLERETAIRFLGFLPAAPSERRRWLGLVEDRMSPPARAFWRENGRTMLRGPIWAGRYERYVAVLRLLLRPIAGRRFRRLVECATLEEQREVFARDFDRPLLRLVFRLAFSPRVYRRRGLDPRGLQHFDPLESLGARFFQRFRAMCVASLARDNPLLQVHLLGRVHNLDAVPEYLTEHGAQVVRERSRAVTFVHASVLDFLASSSPGVFDRFHLSNIVDWLPDRAFEQLLTVIADRARRPARLVWRYLHRDAPIPETLRSVIQPNPGLGDRLRERDRFPIYGVVAADIPT